MKHFQLIIMAVLLISCIPPVNASTYIDSSSLTIELINQNPDPARPGETMELTFSVLNAGNEDLENIVIEIEPEYPFSKVSGESLTKTISYLDARQDDENAAIVKFKLLVDSNAPEKLYELDLTSYDDTTELVTTGTIDIDVRGKEYAQIVTVSKSSIDTATEEELEFIVTNTGNSPLKNMVISWEDASGTILPVYSDNTKYINYLAAGESETISYTVMADINADPGLYQLDIDLTFEDYDSSTGQISTRAGLFVGGETDFDVSFSESSSGEVSLTVANVGNNQAYSVKLSIPEQSGYRVTGSSSSIVGNLDTGDYTITSFSVASTQTNSTDGETGGVPDFDSDLDNDEGSSRPPLQMTDSQGLQVLIEYTDSTGDRVSVDKYVQVSLIGTDESTTGPGRPGDTGSSILSTSNLVYIVIILAIAGGAYYYRKKRNDKEDLK